MQILVVEDERRMAELLRRGLSEEGHRVVVARDGAEGFEMARSSAFDVIVLDVMLPRRNGLAVTRRLRESRNQTPVLLLTAKVQSSDQRRFADLGVEAILFKPFDPLTLSTQISDVLGWS